MSYNRSNIGSGSMNVGSDRFEFGRTYVVRPTGTHEATIVWLHGIGETGSSWSQFLEPLPLPNVKWICPTAPTRPITLFGGHHSTAWFNVEELSENATDDVEGLDASAAHIANMLSNERDDIKLGVAGFSMGAAMALYSATCRVIGQYRNGNRYPINLSVAVALSGWLPCSRIVRSRVNASQDAARRAASLPVLVCHGLVDDVVEHKHGEKTAEILRSSGFQNIMFYTYNGLGHYTIPQEMYDVCSWLVRQMGINGNAT
ncbi:hypothetical protein QVD17_39689 [Tagetes erecta]|uniref:Phospholipase/carboxylesterase/thioesterase domain-containing protein n=1 Tax=Tagetes erecta TaxID=13708 RepID=A0AAD8JQZ8_TARER|nr:hypothetical protein QVD17_39689 [Tagetes erecta]